MKYANYKNILKGVSTLDAMKKNCKAFFFLIILFAFSANIFGRGGHSTLDLVDPSFNPSVQTNSYGVKHVFDLSTLPDGKILAFGDFNNYNGLPVGKLIRLNADGSLDTTFNNLSVTYVGSGATSGQIIVQPDGKIILIARDTTVAGQQPKRIVRLNENGTFDSSFSVFQNAFVYKSFLLSSGKLVVMGDFITPQGSRRIVRLNADGSLDDSFDFTPSTGASLDNIGLQGDKTIVITSASNVRRIYRLSEDGSEDVAFTPLTGGQLTMAGVQPGGKVLYIMGANASGPYFLRRLNEDGGSDDSFQEVNLSAQNVGGEFKFTPDGKIIIARIGNPSTIYRFLSNGASDPSYSPYTATNLNSFHPQSDDSILLGDTDWFSSGSNNFRKLTPGGVSDAAFNSGGTGFRTILPGRIQAIDTQADGKVLLGGKFDLINDIARSHLARLNADSTVDASFRLNTTSGSGNYFSAVREIYQVRVQANGKMILSGWFDYVLNGENKQNIVRLNADGSIDPTFNLTYRIPDWSQILLGGQNRFSIFDNGKLMIASSKANGLPFNPGPTKLTEGGAYDSSFSTTLNGNSASVHYDDVLIQPDGKIVAAGSHTGNANEFRSFIARFNSDGTLDATFSYIEESGRLKSRIVLLPSGKILRSKYSYEGGSAIVQRLNSNGSVDASFTTLTLSDATAKVNALLVLPNGKIFAGGKFTTTVNSEERKNLLQLSESGGIEPTIYNINEEVLALAADADGRVLVGGGFTVIGANGDNVSRSYVARLTDSGTRFDFDGDGKSDLSVFTPQNGKWVIQNSGTNQTTELVFGIPGDKVVAADYDGDGKTDIAVFRPSTGVWYFWRSRDGFGAIQWGTAEDKPVAADYDGDGLADVAVWRPSNGAWYIRKSSDGQSIVIQFGLSNDVPLADADFDGDGKTDIAVWRPSTGIFYWLASGSGNRFSAFQLGLASDVPVVGDFNGDGKTDIVVFRPAGGDWYRYLSAANGTYTFSHYNFGLSGDEPIAADYDGDGKTDIAVRRQNFWHIVRSGEGYANTVFAKAGDMAVASSLNR